LARGGGPQSMGGNAEPRKFIDWEGEAHGQKDKSVPPENCVQTA